MSIKKQITSTAVALALGVTLSSAAFAKNPDVGGAPMYENKNIVEKRCQLQRPHHACCRCKWLRIWLIR